MANYCIGPKLGVFRVLIRCLDARPRRPFHSFDCHRRPACTAGRPPFRPCGVAARQTSAADSQSRPQTCSNLRATERILAGLCTLFMNPVRVLRSAIVLKPSTLLHLHHVLAKRKYRTLFSRKRRRPPGPKGPNKELIDAVVELK